MTIYQSVRAIAGASGETLVDWDAVAEAAKASMDPGSIELSPAERRGYATDVTDARAAIQSVAGVEFDLPETIEVQNRHHWIDANVDTFRRVMEPFETRVDARVPGIARMLNTGSLSVTLGFLGRNVLGQYDPLLLADAPRSDHGLYFVHPNIHMAAQELDVDGDRFRRWIAFHEVTHAAEFAYAPWLPDHLIERMEHGIDALADGSLDRNSFAELQTTMTTVEGYAELLMDKAFDEEYEELRTKLDDRRQQSGVVSALLRRVLGLDMKREQYERGREFFDAVVSATDIETATRVWESPDHLPTSDELDRPYEWLKRVDAQ